MRIWALVYCDCLSLPILNIKKKKKKKLKKETAADGAKTGGQFLWVKLFQDLFPSLIVTVVTQYFDMSARFLAMFNSFCFSC